MSNDMPKGMIADTSHNMPEGMTSADNVQTSYSPEESLAQDKEFMETTGALLPVVGAALAGTFLGPQAIPAGAAIGKGLFDVATGKPWFPKSVRNAMTIKEKDANLYNLKSTILDSLTTSEGSVVGDMAKEYLANYVAGKFIGAIAGSKLANSFVEATNKAIIAPSYKTVTRALGKTGEVLSNMIGKLPEQQSLNHAQILADKWSAMNNVPQLAAARGIARPRQVFNDFRLGKTGEELPINTKVVDDTAGMIKTIFKDARDDFESEVLPIMKSNNYLKFKTDTIKTVANDTKNLTNKTPVAGTGTPIYDSAGNVISEVGQTIRESGAGMGMNRSGLAVLKDVRTRANNLGDTASLEELDQFKRRINLLFNSKEVQGNYNLRKYLMDIRDSVTQPLYDNIPEYATVMKRYKDIFDLEDEIGTKLDPLQVVGTLKSMFNPDKVVLKNIMQSVANKNPENRKIWDDALDRTAQNFFLNSVKEGNSPGAGIQAGRIGFNLGVFNKTSAYKIGESILRKTQRDTFYPGQYIALKSTTQTIAPELLRGFMGI